MGRTRWRPTYSLEHAKSLARSGQMFVNGRISRHIRNHYGILDLDDFLVGLFDSIESDDFYKSIELDMPGDLHGVFADVYLPKGYENEDWYVKFTIDEEGNAHLNVLSANTDGYIH